MSRNYLSLNLVDYDAEASQLSATQRGIHISFLVHCFKCGALPAEPVKLMRIAGISDARLWKKVAPGVLALFRQISATGGWRHRGMDAANDRIHEISEGRERAARKRWNGGANGAAAPIDNQATHPVDNQEVSQQNMTAEAVSDVPFFTVTADTQPIDIAKSASCKSMNMSSTKEKIRKEEVRETKEVSRDRAHPDVLRDLFVEGLPILVGLTGMAEARCRGMLGKLRKEADDDSPRVLAALHRAADIRPTDPYPWLLKAVQAERPNEPPPFDPAKLTGAPAAWFNIQREKAALLREIAA